jgi:hypothetical protein
MWTNAMNTARPTLRDMKKVTSRMSFSLKLRRSRPREGSSSAAELLYRVRVAKRTGARLIGEIGFNAGLSSYAFLNSARCEGRFI